jgi:hypothetical protein
MRAFLVGHIEGQFHLIKCAPKLGKCHRSCDRSAFVANDIDLIPSGNGDQAAAAFWIAEV